MQFESVFGLYNDLHWLANGQLRAMSSPDKSRTDSSGRRAGNLVVQGRKQNYCKKLESGAGDSWCLLRLHYHAPMRDFSRVCLHVTPPVQKHFTVELREI